MSAARIIEKLLKETKKKGFDPILDYNDDVYKYHIYGEGEFADYDEEQFIEFLSDEIGRKDGWKKDDEVYKRRAKKQFAKYDKTNDGLPTEGPIFKQALENYIDIKFDEFEDEFFEKATFKNGKIELYRCLDVDLDKFIADLKQGKTKDNAGMGLSWSWEKDAAECHWGSGEGVGITVTALASPTSINYPRTAFHNLNESLTEEKEIELLPDKPIFVTEVVTDDGDVVYTGKQKINAQIIAALRRITYLKTS